MFLYRFILRSLLLLFLSFAFDRKAKNIILLYSVHIIMAYLLEYIPVCFVWEISETIENDIL